MTKWQRLNRSPSVLWQHLLSQVRGCYVFFVVVVVVLFFCFFVCLFFCLFFCFCFFFFVLLLLFLLLLVFVVFCFFVVVIYVVFCCCVVVFCCCFQSTIIHAVNYPSYSSNLNPCDFFVLPRGKGMRSGKKYKSSRLLAVLLTSLLYDIKKTT